MTGFECAFQRGRLLLKWGRFELFVRGQFEIFRYELGRRVDEISGSRAGCGAFQQIRGLFAKRTREFCSKNSGVIFLY